MASKEKARLAAGQFRNGVLSQSTSESISDLHERQARRILAAYAVSYATAAVLAHLIYGSAVSR